jgi:hypothetical protein
VVYDDGNLRFSSEQIRCLGRIADKHQGIAECQLSFRCPNFAYRNSFELSPGISSKEESITIGRPAQARNPCNVLRRVPAA